MTRETDSSSSGSQGRGAAYPSGTQPYGTRPFPSLHPQERQGSAEGAQEPGADLEPAPAPAADEPKTETTLTTRIRINIPGSRPIPPVIVRTPVDENATAAAAEQAAAEQAAAELAAAAAAPEPEPEKKEKASDWFAPRKPVAAAPQQGPGPEDGTGPAGPDLAAGPGAEAQNPVGGPGPASGSDLAGGPDPVGGGRRPVGSGPATSGLPGGGPAPVAPSGPQPDSPDAGDPFTGPYADSFTDAVPAVPGPFPAPPGAGDGGAPAARHGDGPRPFAPDDFPPGVPRPAEPFGPVDPFDATAPFDDPHAPRTGDPFASYRPPAGPTTGPVTGDMRIPPVDTSAGFRPADASNGFRPADTSNGFRPPVTQGPPVPPEERGSSDTLVSGIPTVPSADSRIPRPAGTGGSAATPTPATARPVPAPAAPVAVPAPAPAPAKRKRRSKLPLIAVAVGFLVVVAYGTGLLMNHADVPKGTTVLGVDIGNKNQSEAVKTLNKALGDRTTADLTLTFGGRKQALKPSVAGLSIDTDATVRSVAHTDYNPASVIGTLLGDTHRADPVIVVDEDKLKAALKSTAGKTTAGGDGMVRFSQGKAVAVPGKPSQSFDVDAAATEVAAAYRTRAETGVNQPIPLKVTTVPPKVSQAALDKAVNGFGKTAMSGFVTVQANAFHGITFGPYTSVPKFLTMVPDANGQLAPHIDLKVLQSLYGGTFDGLTLKRADGKKTPVTAQDVATALITALKGTTASARTVTLPNVAL